MRKSLILLLLFAKSNFASLYPIITSISATYNSSGASYDISEQLLNVGSTADRVPITGYILFGHRHAAEKTSPMNNTFVQVGYFAVDGKKTFSQLGQEFYKQRGSPAGETVQHGGKNVPGKECIGYVYSPTSVSPLNEHPAWADIQVIGGCLVVPPAEEWCRITTPELLLDHGTIELKNAEGDTATTQMRVECTAPMEMKFNLIADDKYIYLDEGKSEISVDGLPLNTKISLPDGVTELPVTDLLSGITTEGFHTGSSVLVMMPY